MFLDTSKGGERKAENLPPVGAGPAGRGSAGMMPPALPPRGVSGSEGGAEGMARAMQDLRVPALGLRVAAVLNLVLVLLVLGLVVLTGIFAQVPQPMTIEHVNGGEGLRMMQSNRMTWSAMLLLVLAIPGFLLNLFILRSARYMQRLERYGRCVVACCLTVLAFPGNILGVPMAIWALVVLSQRYVKEAFAQKAAGKNVPAGATGAGQFAYGAAMGTAVFHLCLVVGFVWFFVFYLPLKAGEFKAMHATLPIATAWTIQFGQMVQHWFCLLMPVAGVFVVGMPFLAQYLGGRKLVRVWSWVFLVGMGLFMVTAALTLRLPMFTLQTVVMADPEAAVATAPPVELAESRLLVTWK